MHAVSFNKGGVDEGQQVGRISTDRDVTHEDPHPHTDLRRGPEPWFVITGDTLFSGAVGRPDLPGHARENAGRLYASLHEKLLSLPDDLEVYPAHFGGSACGAGLSGKPSTTIGFEKRFNRTLALARDEFVEAVAVVPPKPEGSDAIMEFNRGERTA